MSSEQALELHALNSLKQAVDCFPDTQLPCNFIA